MTNNYNNHFEEENFSFDKNKKNPFSMPNDYFDLFAQKMKMKLELEEELKEFVKLSSIIKENGFSVPQNYFADAEIKLEHSLELQLFSALNAIKKPELKPVSEKYFEASQKNILLGIEIAEELKQYSTLYALDKQNNFAVPTNYFDSVAEHVKEVYYSTQTSRVSIVETIFSFLLRPRVALAYSTCMIIFVAAFFYLNNENAITIPEDCKTIACLEKNEILDKENLDEFTEETLYDMVDENSLDQILNEEPLQDFSTDTDTSIN